MPGPRVKVEVYEGQVLDRAIMSEDGRVILCKAGTIMTPALIQRLSNWVIRVERGKKTGEQESQAPAANINRDEILRRLDFDEIVSQKTRGDVEEKQEQVFGRIAQGESVMSLNDIEDAISAMVEETPDDPNVPVKLFELKQHSSYMYSHCMECGVLASFVATNLKYPHQDVVAFSTAMMLHDVGILTVPNELLTKKTPLTREEWAMIVAHCERGFEVLKNVAGVEPLTLIVTMGHHTYADGTGYPETVDFAELPMLAHIAAVINDFESLTAEYQPFERAASPHGAVKILMQRHARYHPTALEQFVRVVGIFPIATFVEINTGDTGVVVRNNPENLFLPEVKLVTDPNGNEYKKEIIVNLIDEDDTCITGVRDDL